jgi:hypothetical protein
MRDPRSDRQRPVLDAQALELFDGLDVDELSRLCQPELHEQQELRSAAIDGRVVPETLQEIRRLFYRAGPVKLERTELHG